MVVHQAFPFDQELTVTNGFRRRQGFGRTMVSREEETM
jgi:hypothetical protein